MSGEIKGHVGIRERTGLTRDLVYRAMRLYQFPKPIRTERRGSGVWYVWSEAEILAWLIEHHATHPLYAQALHRLTAPRENEK